MNISEYIALCKKNSYDLKKFHPTPENHARLLDISAQEFGFKHYTADVSYEAVEKAGGDYCEFIDGILYNVDSIKSHIKHQLKTVQHFVEPLNSFLDNNENDDSCKCLNAIDSAEYIFLNPKRLPDDARLIAIKAVEQVITDSHLIELWKEGFEDYPEGYDEWEKPHLKLIDKLKGQLSKSH